MPVTQDVETSLMQPNERLASSILPRKTWNSADQSLYQPVNLYRVPLEEARDMPLKAISSRSATTTATVNKHSSIAAK